MDKKTFTFELVDKYTPEAVIRDSLKQIEEATNGYVMGNIAEYGGPISTYTKNIGGKAAMLGALGTLATKTETVQVDIQNDLGELDDEDNRYEVYLTVKGLEYYKYRMMFVDYGAVSYPVTIVMNEALAREYNGGKRNERFSLNTMKELEDMLDIVINSDTMLTLIQNLINESLRQELRAESSEVKEQGEAETP